MGRHATKKHFSFQFKRRKQTIQTQVKSRHFELDSYCSFNRRQPRTVIRACRKSEDSLTLAKHAKEDLAAEETRCVFDDI